MRIPPRGRIDRRQLPARGQRAIQCYRELPLFQGDPVRVTALVVPAAGRAGGAYRAASTADFVAVYDDGPAVVEDESPSVE